MYLEISGRRTGKTTRLLQAVEQYTREDICNQSVIVIPNPSLITWYKEQLSRECRKRVEVLVEPRHHLQVKEFVDEFDLCEPGNLDISARNYYTGSAHFLRTLDNLEDEKDVLLQLLKLNDGFHVAYRIPNTSIDELKRFRINYPSDEYRKLLGDWIA